MSASNCLNCGQTIHSKFCPDCGQKTDTHRLVLKHFLLHDMLHGVWHLERGILFTLKEAVIRPGQAALDYISGKRIRYYNVFYLCLLVIGFNLLLGHFLDSLTNENNDIQPGNDVSKDIVDFFDKYLKFILLGIVPIISFSAFLVFRRLKLNLAEHFIIGGICLLGKLMMGTVLVLMGFVSNWLPGYFDYVILSVGALVFLWPIWVYRNAVKGYYKVLEYSWRVFFFYLISLILMITVLVVILISIAGDGEFNINTDRPRSAHSEVSSPPSS